MTDLQTLRRIAEVAISRLEIDSCWCSTLPRDEKCDAHKHADILRDMNKKLLRVAEYSERFSSLPFDYGVLAPIFVDLSTALADLQEK